LSIEHFGDRLITRERLLRLIHSLTFDRSLDVDLRFTDLRFTDLRFTDLRFTDLRFTDLRFIFFLVLVRRFLVERFLVLVRSFFVKGILI